MSARGFASRPHRGDGRSTTLRRRHHRRCPGIWQSFKGPRGRERTLDAWYDRDCSAVELGFITHGAPANVYWVHPRSGERHMQRRLIPGDDGTVWLTAGLGHRFVVVEEASGETLGEYEATHDAIHDRRSASAYIKAQRRAVEAHGGRPRKLEQNSARTASKGPGPNAVMIGRPYHLLFLRISPRTGTTTPRHVWFMRSGGRQHRQLVACCVEIKFQFFPPITRFVPVAASARWREG